VGFDGLDPGSKSDKLPRKVGTGFDTEQLLELGGRLNEI
jgi:hypothetical protein